MVAMHVHRPICQGQLIEKIRPLTLLIWVLGKFDKKSEKCKKLIFLRLLKMSSSVALITTK